MAVTFLVLVVAVMFTVTVSVVMVTLPPRQVMKLSFSEEPELSPSISLSASDHLLILETLDKPRVPSVHTGLLSNVTRHQRPPLSRMSPAGH